MLMPLFTEEEKEVCLRGRNAHVSHVPKNSSVADYHAATAFECVFDALREAGIQEGDTVSMYDLEFDFVN